MPNYENALAHLRDCPHQMMHWQDGRHPDDYFIVRCPTGWFWWRGKIND